MLKVPKPMLKVAKTISPMLKVVTVTVRATDASASTVSHFRTGIELLLSPKSGAHRITHIEIAIPIPTQTIHSKTSSVACMAIWAKKLAENLF